MRSSAGVGTTPPNVAGAPKPASSVMMSRMLGAPFGGTTRGGHHGVDSDAFSLITPPNFGSGGGSCFPSIVVVAPGEPGIPVVSTARAGAAASRAAPLMARIDWATVLLFISPFFVTLLSITHLPENAGGSPGLELGNPFP